MQYVAHSLDVDRLYQGILRPVMQELLVNVVVPQLYFSQEDADLWAEDPQEYIRKGYDIIEDLYSPRTAATNFLLELVSTKKRSKDSLTMLMAHLVQIVQGVTALGAAAPPEACRQLDGALLALGSINDKLKRTKPYKGQLEQMLTGFVAPLFQSPAGHLRAKACWICGQFADIRFAEGKGQGQSFMGLMQLVMQRLQDPELPVKVDAVVALRAFVEYVEGLDPLRPILPALLDVFFKLMNEVDNEDLVMTLETLVEKFEDEISPYAVGICKNLAAAFWKLMQTGEGDDEDEDEMGALAAVGCLRAVATILESISSVPALYVELEPILFPILAKMSTIEGQDVYEEILEILAYFTYVTPQISPQLWSIWPNLIEVSSLIFARPDRPPLPPPPAQRMKISASMPLIDAKCARCQRSSALSAGPVAPHRPAGPETRSHVLTALPRARAPAGHGDLGDRVLRERADPHGQLHQPVPGPLRRVQEPGLRRPVPAHRQEEPRVGGRLHDRGGEVPRAQALLHHPPGVPGAGRPVRRPHAPAPGRVPAEGRVQHDEGPHPRRGRQRPVLQHPAGPAGPRGRGRHPAGLRAVVPGERDVCEALTTVGN